MTSDELYELFRSEIDDDVAPHLWSDFEVWSYMNDAYKQFVRLTGGVADISSSITEIDIVADEATTEVSKKILKYREARLVSTGRKLTLINYTDTERPTLDYGNAATDSDTQPGEVHSMIFGEQKGLVRWVQVPLVADTVKLSVMRLPLDKITGDGQEFVDVDEEHHESLLLWMKARAHMKQDAETFDKGRAQDFRAQFEGYCGRVREEWERHKSKPRVIAYGGI